MIYAENYKESSQLANRVWFDKVLAIEGIETSEQVYQDNILD